MNQQLGLLLTAIITIMLISTVGISLVSMDKQETIDELETERNEWKEEAIRWEQNYINYECPNITFEPIIKYVDVFIDKWHNDTIWNNETIYIYVNNTICDVNRDGSIDHLDAYEVIWYVKKSTSIIEDLIFIKYGNPYEKLYDVNVDGCVTFDDVSFILDHSD